MKVDDNMREYIKGFEAGCDFMIREIELFSKQQPSLNLENLIKHLKQESKDEKQAK